MGSTEHKKKPVLEETQSAHTDIDNVAISKEDSANGISGWGHASGDDDAIDNLQSRNMGNIGNEAIDQPVNRAPVVSRLRDDHSCTCDPGSQGLSELRVLRVLRANRHVVVPGFDVVEAAHLRDELGEVERDVGDRVFVQ